MQNDDIKLISWSTKSKQFPTDIIDDDVRVFIEKMSELPDEDQERIIKVAEKLIAKS